MSKTVKNMYLILIMQANWKTKLISGKVVPTMLVDNKD